MQHHRIDGYDLAYLDIGRGPLLFLIHGSLDDFRIWSPMLGPLSRHRRVIVPSLRHFFPAQWDGIGGGFTIARHVADMIAFIEALAASPIDLVGHSRGGHIAFRVAQQRPDLLRRLVLAEPGGSLDASLEQPGMEQPASIASHLPAALTKIAAGDVEGGLSLFFDAIEGPGAWAAQSEGRRQPLRDNARTLLGQIHENRQPYTLADAQSIRTPTLFVGGEKTVGSLPVILQALAANVPGAQVTTIPGAAHAMHQQNPVAFSEAILSFLA